jgi:hypothetical protein
MSTIANLLIKIGVDVSDADRDMSRFGSKAGKGLRRSLVPAIGVLTGLGLAAKAGFGEFVGAQKVTAQTNATLKSTGNAANTSVGAIQNLSGALMQKSGVDDEVIQSGANMLLTFTNVRNEVGKGNAIFDQATSTALDMSVALGQDMKSSSMQLGKALNDPIKGVSALQRVGVTFTAGQKKSIKAMVDSGNTMGAQKVILQELQKEFGGSAAAAGKTLPGQLAIAQQTFSNLAGSIVGAVMPAFMTFAGILGTVANWMTKHETATKVIIGVMGGLAAAVVVANVALKVQAAATTAVTVAKGIATAATKAWTAGQWLLNAALSANPIGLVIIAVAGLAAAIVIAWKNSATFRAIVTGAFDAVKTAAMATWNWIKSNWPLLLAILTGPIGIAITAIVKNWDKVTAAVDAVKSAIGTIVGAVQRVKDSPALQAVDNAFGTVFGAVKSLINSVASAIDNVIGKVQTAISYVNSLASKVGSVLSKAGGLASKVLPFTADGGIFSGAQARIIGEAGPEAVIPLTRPRRAQAIMEAAGLDRMQQGNGGGPTVHVQTMVVQDATDIDRIAARLGRQLMMAG